MGKLQSHIAADEAVLHGEGLDAGEALPDSGREFGKRLQDPRVAPERGLQLRPKRQRGDEERGEGGHRCEHPAIDRRGHRREKHEEGQREGKQQRL
ncbi:hypothetical protein [Massilia terrae]|uniref:Uncharacterized protein n=1 Tax=Massilia terrae TaxID=1811224 RepID=A0ABT2D1D0_9BURK|nr:hypothetical protein [Massilia terrae]MCS0659845.1 hypothetical protein [Massilia terrae]